MALNLKALLPIKLHPVHQPPEVSYQVGIETKEFGVEQSPKQSQYNLKKKNSQVLDQLNVVKGK